MSDLSLSLQQAHSQLPVSSYFDPALHAREMQSIFQQGPRYVGHSLAVPNVGDYYALPQENGGRALVRNAGGWNSPQCSPAPPGGNAQGARLTDAIRQRRFMGATSFAPAPPTMAPTRTGGTRGTLIGAPHLPMTCA